MNVGRLGWRRWLALPLGTLGLLAGQAFLALPAQAGIAYVGQYDPTAAGGLHEPYAVTTDELGNVFVADTAMHRVVEFNADRRFVREFGDGGSTTAGTDGHLYYPGGITYFNKQILVADTSANDIQIFDDNGNFLARWPSNGPVQFNAPDGIAVDCAGHVYVANSRGGDGAGDIIELDQAGHFLNEFGHANLAVPVGVAIDSTDTSGQCGIGNLYVADEYNGRIVEFTRDGSFVKYIGSQGSGPMQFDHPDEVALEQLGSGELALWVAESGNFRVQGIVASRSADTWSEGAIIDQSPEGHLNDTHGVAVNGVGHIIVAQTEDAHVFEYENAAPKLSLGLDRAYKGYTKSTSGLWYIVGYNLIDKTCNVLVKATVTVPPNAAHVFTVEQDATNVGDDGATVKVDLSSRQLKWMEQAWQAGHKIPVTAKALGSCSDNVHVHATKSYSLS